MRRLRTGVLSASAGITSWLQDRAFRYRAAFVTLTYAPGVDYNPLQISAALQCLRDWAARRGVVARYVWRMEFGASTGRLHYHVLVWLPKGVTMPQWDRQGWWPHGMTQAQWARNPVGYMSKYASKPAEFPGEGFHTVGARWWGCGGLPPGGRDRLRFVLSPVWVQRIAEAMDCERVRRLQYGWWRVGAWEFRSPWEYVGQSPEGPQIRWRGWQVYDFELAA